MKRLTLRERFRSINAHWIVLCVVGLSVTSPVFAFQIEVPSNWSFTVEAYKQRGMPPIDRPWTPEDYQAMQSMFEKLNRHTRLHVPRLNALHSGAVFARMIADDNLAPLRDSAIPLEDRLKLANGLFGAAQALLPIYAKLLPDGRHFDEEHVEILAYRLKIIDALLKLNDEQAAACTTSDEHCKSVRTKRDRMQNMSGRLVIATIEAMGPNVKMRKAARLTMSQHLAQLLPGLIPSMTPDHVNKARSRIAQYAAAFPTLECAKVLSELATKLSTP